MANGTNKDLILSQDDLEKLISNFEASLTIYSPEERKDIMRAVSWAQMLHKDQKRASGEPYIIHPVASTGILIDLKMDSPTIIASILHDVLEDTSVDRAAIGKDFGDEVAMLVDGVTKIDIVEVGDKSIQQIETLRKMIFAMVKDLRVIFIKLADRRHNMNTLQFMPPHKQKRISQECLDIYAPLAGRLGINTVKMELEDLSLKFLHPDHFQEIKSFVDHKKDERSLYLDGVRKEILEVAEKEGITDMTVETRAKHFYSIYRKMKYKGKDLEEIFDFLGVRILCKTKTDCYHILGIVHQLWPPIEGRFKDYIAMPKANDYQSLHTTIRGKEHRPLEIQIRTFEMDETANYGVAAHFLYKEGKKHNSKEERNISFIHKLKNWSQADYSSTEFIDSIKRDLLQDTIIVYTPKGSPIVLPKGSTAIDFAYHIHSDIGSHCVRAKANGAIIPLTKPLKNTQTVEVMTHPDAHPHQNWLRFTKSHRARDKIRQWINKHTEDYVIEGNIIARPGKDKKQLGTPLPPEKVQKKEEDYSPEQKVLDKDKVTISLDREKNLMIKLSLCCKPTVGDDIIGYVSRGRGITVHRKDCPNLSGIDDFENRKVEVAWETATHNFYRQYNIIAKRTADLFSEIEGAIKKHGGHLISGNVNESDRGNLEGSFTVEMDKKKKLSQISKSIRAIPSVYSIYESTGPSHFYGEDEEDDD